MSEYRRDGQLKSVRTEAKYKAAAILSLSIKGYHQLDEVKLGVFFDCVLPDLYNLMIKDGGDDYKYKTRMDERVILIHSDFERLTQVGLDMCDYFNDNKYSVFSLLKGEEVQLRARLAIHKGEFITAEDVLHDRRPCLYGREVLRATLIEQFTPWGRLWATSELRKALEERWVRQRKKGSFDFREHGVISKPDDQGEEMIHEITHKDVPPRPFPDPGKAESDKTQIVSEAEIEKLRKIATIITNISLRSNLDHCAKDGSECCLPSQSLCLAAELLRNTETIDETREFLIRCECLWKYATEMDAFLRDPDKRIEEIYPLVIYLKREMKMLFELFSILERNYVKNWIEDMNKSELSQKRLSEYLKLRIKLADPTIPGRFQSSLLTMRRILCEENGEAYSTFTRRLRESGEFREALIEFIDLYSREIRSTLKSLVKARRIETKKALEDGLGSFDYKIACDQFESTIGRLPHNQKPRPLVPPIFPRSIRNDAFYSSISD